MADESVKPEAPATAAPTTIGAVVPLHAATGNGIKRGPGRPKKVNPKPTTDDLLYHAEMIRQKGEFVAQDPLVRSTKTRQEPIETLQVLKAELAEEAAALLFTRIEEEKYGRDTSQISTRRISALREVANIELEIKKLGITEIDLKGERFQKIFAHLLNCVKEAAEEVLSAEQADLLFNRMETKLEGWEEQAQAL